MLRLKRSGPPVEPLGKDRMTLTTEAGSTWGGRGRGTSMGEGWQYQYQDGGLSARPAEQ